MSQNSVDNNQLANKEGVDFLWSLYEHAVVGVVQVAADGTLKWANAALCSMLGYSQNELLEKAFEDIVPAKDRARQLKLLHKILTGKYRCYDVEEHFLHRTGTQVSATVTPLAVNGNGPGSYCTHIVRHNLSSKTAGPNLAWMAESAPNPAPNVLARGTESRDHFGGGNSQTLRDRRESISPRKDGATVQLNLHAISFRDHEWGLAPLTDMTDHSRALQSLQESEERFRTIFNDAPAGMALTSTSGRFIFVNTALCDFLGYSRNKLSAKNLLAITHPEDREATLQQLTQMENGQTARTREEHRFVHKNGQALWGDVRRSLIRDSRTGKPKYIVSQIIDITDRKRMEQKLRETEQRFRTIADSAPVLIWMAGQETVRTYFNRGWLDFTGRALEEELEDGWIQRVHLSDVSSLVESYRSAFDQHAAFTLSYRIRRHDGEYRWLVDTGVPRFNPDGSFAGYVGSCIDETDRRAAEEVLRNVSRKLIEAQEKERKRIARELHDDINQRLAMLAIELQQLDSSPVFQARRHERIERLLKRTTEISSDLQALSHELHSVTLEHLGIAAAMRSFCNDLGRHQKVNVEFVEKTLPSWIPSDVALALLRVLQEGVHNAVKHSGVRKIYVELMGRGNEIQLTIRDFGVGFDLERAAKGEGLGLLSMKERVLPFKGTLMISSKPKQGTELIVRIPIHSSAIGTAS